MTSAVYYRCLKINSILIASTALFSFVTPVAYLAIKSSPLLTHLAPRDPLQQSSVLADLITLVFTVFVPRCVCRQ